MRSMDNGGAVWDAGKGRQPGRARGQAPACWPAEAGRPACSRPHRLALTFWPVASVVPQQRRAHTLGSQHGVGPAAIEPTRSCADLALR